MCASGIYVILESITCEHGSVSKFKAFVLLRETARKAKRGYSYNYLEESIAI